MRPTYPRRGGPSIENRKWHDVGGREIVRGSVPTFEGVHVKATQQWYSQRVQQDITLVRWGHYGTPVLVFPTAGGDAEEVERQHLVRACSDLIDGGRVKLYSCESIAGRALLAKEGSSAYQMRLLNYYHELVRRELVPAIYNDSGGTEQLIVTTGSSIGAFNALAVLCRYPDVFGAAIGMSGTYKIERFYDGPVTEDFYLSSPMHFLPNLEGPALDLLRQRFVVLASGRGAHEDIDESWAAADVLGRKGIPNRVDDWGLEWPHEWPTWWRMLPQYLEELA
jgi:esterase/lipase superfamily enzyme